MTSKERVRKAMNFEEPDRVPLFEWYWPGVIERWKAEGLPADADPRKFFGYDIVQVGFDHGLRFERRTLEETEDTYVEQNEFGMTQRLWKPPKCGAPEQIDRVIKTRADWEQHKHRLAPSADRFADKLPEWMQGLHDEGAYLTYWYLEPFELAWRFLGFKETLMMMAAEPDLIHDIFEACADQVIGCYEAVTAKGVRFDGNWAGGDIAGKNGPLFSPKMYRELLMPHHKRIFSYFNERGVPTMYHGDGDDRPILDDLIEAGVRALHPCEVKAGMDLVELKKRCHGRLVLFGGIDVRALERTKADIDREIRAKLPVAMKGGGYIYCVDHSVTPNVSFENYQYALSLIREIGTYK